MTIPLPEIPKVHRVSLIWGGGGATPIPVNVIHFRTVDSGKVASDVFACLNTHVSHAMWNPLLNGLTITTVNIITLDGSSATATFTTDGTTKWMGATSGGGIPQAAALVKLQTGLRGRNHRGRIYLPWVSEGAALSGVINSTILTAWQAAWNTFGAGVQADTTTPMDLGVAAYDRAHLGAGATFTPLTAIVCESLTATQRRRQPGRKVARHRTRP